MIGSGVAKRKTSITVGRRYVDMQVAYSDGRLLVHRMTWKQVRQLVEEEGLDLAPTIRGAVRASDRVADEDADDDDDE